LALINSTSGSQTLARRLYRTFAREDTETVHQEDLRFAFDNDEESDAAFTMFDKDLNGDISMEELEAVCVEIGRERKAITASLKDLDSVVGKLDDCLLFAVVIISVLVFISLISTSAAGVLTSAGSTVLALSWLLQATAQEFLQSLIFVFVKVCLVVIRCLRAQELTFLSSIPSMSEIVLPSMVILVPPSKATITLSKRYLCCIPNSRRWKGMLCRHQILTLTLSSFLIKDALVDWLRLFP